MRYTKVSREGIVNEPPLAQLAYGALIQGRVSMITGMNIVTQTNNNSITIDLISFIRLIKLCKKSTHYCNKICCC